MDTLKTVSIGDAITFGAFPRRLQYPEESDGGHPDSETSPAVAPQFARINEDGLSPGEEEAQSLMSCDSGRWILEIEMRRVMTLNL